MHRVPIKTPRTTILITGARRRIGDPSALIDQCLTTTESSTQNNHSCKQTSMLVRHLVEVNTMSDVRKKPGGGVLSLTCGIALVLTLAVGTSASETGPQAHLQETLEAITAVLVNPQWQESGKDQARKQEVRRIIYEAFDFWEMSREVLGTQWVKLTPPQQEEFTGLFGNFFERSYNRMILRFLGERQTVYGTTSVNNGRAVVQTTLVSKNDAKLPVDYQLMSHNERWAIYDVVIDGVSLAMNYRAQFTKILRTSSYDTLIQRIKAKIEEERL
jgi:phospholipid transport system substrate-binding protein